MTVSMVGRGIQGVDECVELLQHVLKRVEQETERNAIDAAVNREDVEDLFDALPKIFPNVTAETKKHAQYAVIEIAAREIFNHLLATTTIDKPAFIWLWNLLDIISILSDHQQCDPALLFWLVEELLDSQTIAGCRKVFDYLESRRERITAKHFGQKNLVVLRTCNELLRRLSRAEDTSFCGRVFIFMFQSFPLGDKSSVNLRGEYHTENVTTWDDTPQENAEPMEVDAEPVPTTSTPAPGDSNVKSKAATPFKSIVPISPEALYPIFWSLQHSFNQPKKLFETNSFSAFKTGLEATLSTFRSLQSDVSKHPNTKASEDKIGTKRKRGDGDDLATTLNPKYLTSRDLFELEIGDVSFQRHVLIQVLIVMDFLLSLSKNAKDKLASATLQNANKSVMYSDVTLSDQDVAWVTEIKKSAADSLRQDPFFYRMVETVLSRDKNWVRWKIENCPSIARPPISADEYLAAMRASKKIASNKRLRPTPLGSLDLTFLAETNLQQGLECLKDPNRYELPNIKTFKAKIALDDMDLEMGPDEATKSRASESKASKSWRALRIASSSKLVAFDKIERYDNIEQIFHDDVKVDEPTINGDELVLPVDRRPFAVSGPRSSRKRAFIDLLVSKHGKTFSRKISHTTRGPREGEVNGRDYIFVTKEQFGVLRDGDELLEYNMIDDDNYGTSRKLVESIIVNGKIPIMEMERHGIQQLKASGFAARYVYLAQGNDDTSVEIGQIQAQLVRAKEEAEYSTLNDVYDKVLEFKDLQSCCAEFEKFVFGAAASHNPGKESQDKINRETQSMDSDVEPSNVAKTDIVVAMPEESSPMALDPVDDCKKKD